MKKIILIILVILNSSSLTKGQDFMSTYNLSKNDSNTLKLYNEEYKSMNIPTRKKPNRFAKTMMYSGIIVGGLLLGEQASRHDYYMNNTMIYGVGGVMTILATGLVISGVTGVNKQLYFSVKKEGVTMCLAIN